MRLRGPVPSRPCFAADCRNVSRAVVLVRGTGWQRKSGGVRISPEAGPDHLTAASTPCHPQSYFHKSTTNAATRRVRAPMHWTFLGRFHGIKATTTQVRFAAFVRFHDSRQVRRKRIAVGGNTLAIVSVFVSRVVSDQSTLLSSIQVSLTRGTSTFLSDCCLPRCRNRRDSPNSV